MPLPHWELIGQCNVVAQSLPIETWDKISRRQQWAAELCASSSANRFGDSCVGFLADLLVESLACLVVREHPAPPGGGGALRQTDTPSFGSFVK